MAKKTLILSGPLISNFNDYTFPEPIIKCFVKNNALDLVSCFDIIVSLTNYMTRVVVGKGVHCKEMFVRRIYKSP